MEKTDIEKISERYDIPQKKIIDLLKPKPRKKKEETINKPLTITPQTKKTTKEKVVKKGYLFLPEDYNDLIDRINQISEIIAEAGKETGESCTEGAETFHDNFAYEQGSLKISMWSKEIDKLTKIRNRARIINKIETNEIVSVGKNITIENEETGEVKTIRLGSYIVFKSKNDENKINSVSYSSPIGKLLIGAKIGEKRRGDIGNKDTTLIILKIE